MVRLFVLFPHSPIIRVINSSESHSKFNRYLTLSILAIFIHTRAIMPFVPVDAEWVKAGMPVEMPPSLALTLPLPFGLSQLPRRKRLVFLIRDGDVR